MSLMPMNRSMDVNCDVCDVSGPSIGREKSLEPTPKTALAVVTF